MYNSINGLSAILSSFICGMLATIFGSKKVMLILTLPSVIFWILIYFGDTYYHILIAR